MDRHFLERAPEVKKRFEDFRDWMQREASWIHTDRFLDRAWWKMIDNCNVVCMMMEKYERAKK